MARPSQQANVNKLQALSTKGASGRLTVGAGAAEASIYMLEGEIVAVRAADDAAVLVDRLAKVGLLPIERARQLQAMQAMSLPILGRDGSDPILALLLDQLEGPEVERALDARFDEVLAAFLAQPGDAAFDGDAIPWAHLVRTTGDTMAQLQRLSMLVTAALVIEPRRLLAAGPGEPTSPVDQALLDALVGGPLTAGDLVASLDWTDVVGRGRIASAIERGVLTDVVARPQERSLDDAASEDPAGLPVVPADVDDDQLEAFSGMDDHHRGGESRAGTFVQDAATLDRVELVEDEPSQAREGSGYAAPTLSEEDAFDKLGVANDVLRAAHAALAAASDTKVARATLQVLVDGRPRMFAQLFDSIQVASDGALPMAPLLNNLRQRLPSEQRHLLNQGLLDLLDQALDRVADELDGDAFDELLERVIGYRQRLGL